MGAAQYIFANPGQTIRLVIQVLDGYGNLSDGYVPIVQSVLFPDLSSAVGYPRPMTRLDTGLYANGLVIPTGVSSLGTYIASVFWLEDSGPKWASFAINVARPFGNTTVTPI
jgi:hypothetical protein